MTSQKIKIAPLLKSTTSSPSNTDSYTLCWIREGVEYIEISKKKYKHISNTLIFLSPFIEWSIYKNINYTEPDPENFGYLLYLPKHILNHPFFKNYTISKIHLLKSSDEIPKIKLSPGIEKRVKAIIEMIDELLTTHLKHSEEAINSLLSALFVYCDGHCNIKSTVSDSNSKGTLVYNFKKNIDLNINKFHDVSSYAKQLSVTDKYLNECVREVLGRTAKSLIDEQLIMRARHALKFTDMSVKEVGYSLGFSSPDYFTYYIKKQTGFTPTQYRKL